MAPEVCRLTPCRLAFLTPLQSPLGCPSFDLRGGFEVFLGEIVPRGKVPAAHPVPFGSPKSFSRSMAPPLAFFQRLFCFWLPLDPPSEVLSYTFPPRWLSPRRTSPVIVFPTPKPCLLCVWILCSPPFPIKRNRDQVRTFPNRFCCRCWLCKNPLVTSVATLVFLADCLGAGWADLFHWSLGSGPAWLSSCELRFSFFV